MSKELGKLRLQRDSLEHARATLNRLAVERGRDFSDGAFHLNQAITVLNKDIAALERQEAEEWRVKARLARQQEAADAAEREQYGPGLTPGKKKFIDAARGYGYKVEPYLGCIVAIDEATTTQVQINFSANGRVNDATVTAQPRKARKRQTMEQIEFFSKDKATRAMGLLQHYQPDKQDDPTAEDVDKGEGHAYVTQ